MKDEWKYVYWCNLCHDRVVARGDTAKQLMELIEMGEALGDRESIQALTTCSSCQILLATRDAKI